MLLEEIPKSLSQIVIAAMMVVILTLYLTGDPVDDVWQGSWSEFDTFYLISAIAMLILFSYMLVKIRRISQLIPQASVERLMNSLMR